MCDVMRDDFLLTERLDEDSQFGGKGEFQREAFGGKHLLWREA